MAIALVNQFREAMCIYVMHNVARAIQADSPTSMVLSLGGFTCIDVFTLRQPFDYETPVQCARGSFGREQ